MEILIVDDELIIRQWFTMLVEKIGKGFNVMGAARNGKEAVDFCRENHVDLVVTDIKMPVMDGIELMKVLKKEFNGTRILALSSYNEFQFAVEAMKYGASDYILKPEVTIEQLEEVLNKIDNEIEMEKNHSLEKMKLSSIFKENTYALRDIFFKELLEGICRTIENFESKTKLYNIILEKNNLSLIAFSIDNYKSIKPISKIEDREILDFSIINITDEILRNELKSGCCFRYEENLYIAIFNINMHSAKSFKEYTIILINKIADCLKRFIGVDISAGISIAYNDISMLKKQRQETIEALNQRMFYGGRSITFYQDINTSGNKLENSRISSFLKEILTDLDLMDFTHAVQMIEDLFIEIESQKNLLSAQVKGLCTEITYLFMRKLRQVEATEEDIRGIFGDIHRELEVLLYYVEVKEWLKCNIEKSIGLIQLKSRCFSNPVKKACDFIAKNYNTDIDLNQVADYIHLNRSYFCEIFKKEVGESFNSYLTKTRLETAKEMLKQPDIKVSQLAELVGYNNAGYFAKVFKKYTGVAPVEFKDKHEKANRKTDNSLH